MDNFVSELASVELTVEDVALSVLPTILQEAKSNGVSPTGEEILGACTVAFAVGEAFIAVKRLHESGKLAEITALLHSGEGVTGVVKQPLDTKES